MHFSIPETRELFKDPASKSGQYTVYHLHCNGVFHCYFRYSQAYQLCEDVVERREALEKWFQKIAQDVAISNSNEFRDFLLNQQDEVKLCCEEVDITVYLVNKKCVTFRALTTDQTDEVLEAVCAEIGVGPELTYYFGLFLVKEDGKRFSIIRPLQAFECPHISLGRYRTVSDDGKQVADSTYKIQLRKAYWDTGLDKNLAHDEVATNLVYIQAVEDVRLKHLDMTDGDREQLAKYREAGEKANFVALCGKINGYCFYRWKNVLIDYPKENTKVTVSIGPYELRVRDEANDEDVVKFSVTKMRCWKISSDAPSTVADGDGGDDMEADDAAESKLTLSFDYLFAKDKLQWVTLRSKHAIVISMMLQSVVDELVRKKRKQPIRKPSDRPKRPKPALRPRRDDSKGDLQATAASAAAAVGEGTAGWSLGASAASPPRSGAGFGAGANLAFSANAEENKVTFGAIKDDDL